MSFNMPPSPLPRRGLIEEGYENLANAIIEKAAWDYAALLRQMRRFPEDCRAKADAYAIERFFHREYFAVLTEADPDELIDKLKEHVKRESLKKRKGNRINHEFQRNSNGQQR